MDPATDTQFNPSVRKISGDTKVTAILFALGILANVLIVVISLNSDVGTVLPWLFLATVPLNIIVFFIFMVFLGRDLAVWATSITGPSTRRKSLLLSLPVLMGFIIGAFLYSLHHLDFLQVLHAYFVKFSGLYWIILAGLVTAPIVACFLTARRVLPKSKIAVAISTIFGFVILACWITADVHAGNRMDFKIYIPSDASNIRIPGYRHFPLDNTAPSRYLVSVGTNRYDDSSLWEMKASGSDALNPKTGLCLPSPFNSSNFYSDDFKCTYKTTLSDGTKLYQHSRGLLEYYFVKDGTFIKFSDGSNNPPNTKLIDSLVPAPN